MKIGNYSVYNNPFVGTKRVYQRILGIANSARWINYECYTLINNKKIYNRILIRKK